MVCYGVDMTNTSTPTEQKTCSYCQVVHEDRCPYLLDEETVGYGLAVPGSDRERNGYHDSDFSITWWNPETRQFATREYGTTRYPSATNWPTSGYLTPEHPEWEAALAAGREIAERQELTNHVDAQRTVTRGTPVRVVKPVKSKKNGCPEGATGTVEWAQEETSQYGTWSRGWKFGVDLDDEVEEWNGKTKPRRIFISSDRVERVDAPSSIDDLDPEIVEKVHQSWADADPDRVWAAVAGSTVTAAYRAMAVGRGPRLADD